MEVEVTIEIIFLRLFQKTNLQITSTIEKF